MKTGLELLKARKQNEKLNFKLLEENGIVLPPIYSAFLSSVKTGEFYSFFNLEKGDGFEQDHPFPYLTTLKAKLDYPIVDTLFNEVQILDNYEPELDYIAIGYFASEVFLVGKRDWNQDIVVQHRFTDRTPSDPSFLKIADSIFEYFNTIEEVEYLVNEQNKMLYFKNWGEEFWRVRETAYTSIY